MKEFWLEPSQDLAEHEVRKLVQVSNPDAILFLHGRPNASGRIASNTAGGDILVTRDLNEAALAKKAGATIALECTLRDREDHHRLLKSLAVRPDYLLISCPDWKVIPLENLVADVRGRSKILARTSSFEESRTALQVLELGVDGVVLSSHDPQEIAETRQLLVDKEHIVALTKADVTRVKNIGTGARVCVDTCELIRSGEGLLTGCSSQALFLVEGEVNKIPHVSPRPFRVNAGPVSLYVLTPEGGTCYLSELSAGERVLLVDENGRTRPTDVARVKIERRPMILLEAETEGRSIKTILQNAETVRLTTPNGSRPVSELKPGDQVLVRLEDGGRHFGTRVSEEMILEK